jgi:hypothetical protein
LETLSAVWSRRTKASLRHILIHVFRLVTVDRPITISLKYRLLACFLHLFFHEDDSNALMRNIGELVPYYTASHPRWWYSTRVTSIVVFRKMESGKTLLWNMMTADQWKDNAKMLKQKGFHASECDHGPGGCGTEPSSTPPCPM